MQIGVPEPRTVFHWHCGVIAAFSVGHIVITAFLLAGHDTLFGLSRLLDMGLELSLPTFFSAIALFVTALIAGMLGNADVKERRNWLILALGLLYLAFDEGCQIHEIFDRIPHERSGLLKYFWVLPYGLIALAMTAIMLPFWLRLPRSTKWGLACGFAVFVGAALGMEIVQAQIDSSARDIASFWINPEQLVEEAGEMIGVAIILRALLGHFELIGVSEIDLILPAVSGDPAAR